MKKKIFLITMATVGFSLVACGAGDNPEPEPEPTYVGVNLVSKTLNISCTKTEKDAELVATISLKKDYEKAYNLPVTLGYIEVKDAEDISYTDYTYKPTFNASSTKLKIPAKFITNDITITAEANLVSHKVLFTQSLVFEPKIKAVAKNQSLETTFRIKAGLESYFKLPEELKIKIGDSQKPLKEYVYKPGENEAYLYIDSKYINGDIKIESTAVPETKTANIVDTNGKLTLTNTEITIGTPFETKIYSTDATHYFLPSTLKKVSYHIDDGGGQDIEITNYKYNPTTGTLLIDEEIILGNLTIEADSILQEWYTLSVKTTADDRKLAFSHEGTSITEGSPLYFDYQVIKADESFQIDLSCDSKYIVPKTLKITCNKIDIPDKAYSVTYEGEGTGSVDKTKAKLLITTGEMKGEMYIEAAAIDEDTINIESALLYVTSPDLPTSIDHAIGEISCHINWDDTKHRQPAADNVAVRITKDNTEIWYDGLGYGSDGSRSDIWYNPEASILNVPNSVVKEVDPQSTIVIAVKARDISVLTELTRSTEEYPEGRWDLVHEFSKYGEALFRVGEQTAPFYVGEDVLPYKARLIGINQEIESHGFVVKGLTLEFTSCVDLTSYNDPNYYSCFDGSPIVWSEPYKMLNDQNHGIFAYLPKDLRDNIMPVTKRTIQNNAPNFTIKSPNYLFPLSMVEMNEGLFRSDDEFKNIYANEASEPGKPYRYYEQGVISTDILKMKRAKEYGLLGEVDYWLRTPSYKNIGSSWCISPNSETGIAIESKDICAIAPAFCI